nr:MAG TPA: hypothetical protein [Bacteriophage sp.]
MRQWMPRSRIIQICPLGVMSGIRRHLRQRRCLLLLCRTVRGRRGRLR